MQPPEIEAQRAPRRHRGRLLPAMMLGVTLLSSAFVGGLTAAADEDFPRSALEIRSAHGRQWFNIRIADTAERQELGLMFQTRLAADEGMLFPQPQPHVMSMWMKNTYIPLDMLFIDSHGRIVCLLANTRPQSLEILSCPKPVKAVLEIGGGEAAERGIRVGDRVLHKLLKP
jgi:uncharacterized membrane protein (UPF0127 family)